MSQVEGVPVPCRRCGAAMEEANTSDLYGVQMKCRFCGETETLPAGAAERVLALRSRLQQVVWARQNAEGPALAMVQSIEQYKMAVIPLLLFTGVPCLMQAPTLLGGANDGWSGLLLLAFSGLRNSAVMLGFMGGGLAGMFAYRRQVRPGVLAFAPSSEGAPLRCRMCGGELPSAPSGAFVPCRYCSSQNLVSTKVAKRRVADLQRELAVRQAQAAGVASRMEGARARMMRYAAMGMAGGWLFTMFISVLGGWLVAALS